MLTHLYSMEAAVISLAVEPLLKKLIRLLLDEETREIQSGGEHKIIMAKQELQELEKHISYASFIVAGGVSDPGRFSQWISKAQLDAFCLEDQIAMYAMQGLNEYPSYALKSAIGRVSIEKLTKNIKDHIRNMPDDLKSSDIMAKLSDIPPFIRKSYTVPAPDEILGAKKTTEGINEFLRGGHQVLFIIGGQGSGKTTLVKHVYKSSHIEFTRRRSWVNLAETKGLVGILKKVLEFEGSTIDPDAIDELEIMKTIHDKFKDKDYLIVLDDVQDTCVLYSLMHVLKELKGKIICLTRRTDIHEEHETIRISPLVWQDARMLLMRAAFPGYRTTASEDGFRNAIMWRRLSRPSWSLRLEDLDKMEETLKDMLFQCQGNPWNICTVGAVLEDNPFEKWIEIKGRINRTLIHNNISSSNRDPPIKLEDANLSPKVRLVFLYCLAFPESSEIPGTSAIPKRKLIRLWTAEGFLHDSGQNQEQEAEGLLDELIKMKLLVVNKRGVNGEVLKYSVNEHIRHLALKMSEYQKFCRFVTKQDEEESSPSTRTENSQDQASSCLNILPWARWTKAALSIRYCMLAVHGHGGLKLASAALDKDVRLRSLLYFETDKTEPPKFELSFRHKCMLLRTLELQGANLDRLPSSIGCLVCLRYLGLRRTKLEHLPPSVHRLKHLMCLDIRDTNITSVDDVSTFTEMRHLLFADSFCGKSVVIKQGLRFLIYLQTLSGARHSDQDHQPFEHNLLSLKLLRKLSIKKVSSAASKDMCDAISKMEFLRSLSITSDGEQFDLKFLEIGRNLYKLKLGGDMGALCDRRLSMMQSITYLYLWDSNLQADPLLKLQCLPRLLLLSLYNAYTGQRMRCENGYTKLKKLSIISMENLTGCTFGEGAMNNLEDLTFAKCSKLTSSPQGLEHILSLKHVRLSEMHKDFGKSVKDSAKGVQIHETNMYFHKSSSTATEGSQTKIEKAAPPATGDEGTETKAIIDTATPPRDAKDSTQDTKSGDGACSSVGSKASPSKLMADAQKSYKHSKPPASPTLISEKGKEVLSIENDIQDDTDEDDDSQTRPAGAGYEAGQSIFVTETQIMEQSMEIDLIVEEAKNVLTRLRGKPAIYHLPNFVQSYPGAVQNQPWITGRSTSNVYASGVETLNMDEIETSTCYKDNVCDLRHQTECEIEQLTAPKVVTSTTSSNEENTTEGSQTTEPEIVTPPTTEGEGTTQSMVIEPTTPPRDAKGKTQDTKSGDNKDREEAGQTSSITKTRQNSEQAKEQLTKDHSSDAGALVPRLQESEVHEYDSAAKNASTARAIQSSDSTPRTHQESS